MTDGFAVVDGLVQPGDSPSSARAARRPNRRALAAGDPASRSAPITDMWLASTSRVQSARSSRRPAATSLAVGARCTGAVDTASGTVLFSGAFSAGFNVADALGRGLDAPVLVDNEGSPLRCATSERLQAASTRGPLGTSSRSAGRDRCSSPKAPICGASLAAPLAGGLETSASDHTSAAPLRGCGLFPVMPCKGYASVGGGPTMSWAWQAAGVR